MKKQLLTLVALLFAAVTAMAQVELGAPKWNIKDGAKVSLTKIITLSSFAAIYRDCCWNLVRYIK